MSIFPEIDFAQCLKVFNTIYGYIGLEVRATDSESAYDNVFRDNVVHLPNGVGCLGIRLWSNAKRTRCIGNTIFGNAQADDIGIQIDSGASNNWIEDNDLSDSSLTTKVSDSGTSTTFKNNRGYYTLKWFTMSFERGSDSSNLIGWLTDAEGEYNTLFVHLPSTVYQIAYIEVWGIAKTTETHGMQLGVTVRGGADNEGYATHTVNFLNVTSTSTNFATDDIIYWTCTSGLNVITGGDSVIIRSQYAIANGDNCATNCLIQSVVVYYYEND